MSEITGYEMVDDVAVITMNDDKALRAASAAHPFTDPVTDPAFGRRESRYRHCAARWSLRETTSASPRGREPRSRREVPAEKYRRTSRHCRPLARPRSSRSTSPQPIRRRCRACRAGRRRWRRKSRRAMSLRPARPIATRQVRPNAPRIRRSWPCHPRRHRPNRTSCNARPAPRIPTPPRWATGS